MANLLYYEAVGCKLLKLLNHPRMEVPPTSQQQHLKRSGEPAGGARGGWRWRGGGALIFRQEVQCCWSLCLVGCFSPSVVTSPYLWPGARFLKSCKKVKVTHSWKQSLVDSSLFSCICSFWGFYLQYLKRSRWTWKCSSEIQNLDLQPLSQSTEIIFNKSLLKINVVIWISLFIMTCHCQGPWLINSDEH